MKHFKKKSSSSLSFLLPALCFLVILVLFIQGLTSVSDSASAKQKESLEKALHQNIIHCYAIEGSYPPSITYLKEHYGLTYDETKYYIDYHPVAGNLMPDVTILEIGGSQ